MSILQQETSTMSLSAADPLAAQTWSSGGHLPNASTCSVLSQPTFVEKLKDTKTATILLVDDDQPLIAQVSKYLGNAGYTNLSVVSSDCSALQTIKSKRPDLLLLDIDTSNVSGIELLRQVRSAAGFAHLPIIIIAATDDEHTCALAMNEDATDLLIKPLRPTELILRVRNALLVKSHRDRAANYACELEHRVRKRTAELASSRLELVHCLARIAEYRDNETGRHIIRVGRFSGAIARKLNLDDGTVEMIEHAAPLHDVGKIGIPDAILLKPDRLTPDEFEIMQRHAAIGGRTFEPMNPSDWKTFRSHTLLGETIMDLQTSPLISMASQIALTHHERWDGTGYPLGLKQDEIPIAGRIVAVADVFDALSSRRPYKHPLPNERSFEILREGSGKQFDPRVLEAFFACQSEIEAIQSEYADLD